ncbi:MAG: flavin reductase family protein [SAR202 cluster bacterium]|jgi:flavin reductase (DIM6/NTAB) family NADH-FMN oxidoreductase RutF|nr:flavin reductase family protein [SAR202 cluster bacterium]MDP6512100.1 flavin reductase family protein [SAR202 cluster bacterium]
MNSDAKKQALRQITYGLYIVTSQSGDMVVAGTVNWLSQASFDPPLVMMGAKADSGLHTAMGNSGVCAINFLSADQQDVAQDFFKPTNVDGNKINGHAFTTGSTGSPILDDVYAYLECKVSDNVALGDHTVFVAEVVDAGHRREDKPLEMWPTNWFYGG